MKKSILLLLTAILFVYPSCKKEITDCTDPQAENYNSEATIDCCCIYTVRYLVWGSSGDYNVTYQNSNGGTSQQSNVPSDWTYSFTATPGDFVYLSAQNNNNTGSVSVTIYQGPFVFETSTNTGAFVIATATGTLN